MSGGTPEGPSSDLPPAIRDPQRLQAVRETGLHDPDVPDSLTPLTSLALRTLDCATAFVSVVGEHEILVRAARGDPEPLLEDGPVPVEESFCQNVVARAEPLVVRNSAREGTVGSELALANGLVSYLEVPVDLGDDLVLGGFCVADPRPRDWSDEEIEIVETFAAGVASELRLRRRMHDLEERGAAAEEPALHDPLTGLANRALLQDRVSHALARSERTGGAAAVLFLDVDDLEGVNGRRGHAAGDRVLSEYARRLRETVREGDTAARFGGDEFVVLLEDLEEPSEAEAVTERIADVLREPVELGEGSVPPSVSIGLALSTGLEAGDGRGLGVASRGRRLLQAADWAMYRAKGSAGVGWARY